MTVGELSSRTSLREVVTGHVAVVRGRLAKVVDQAANPCIAPASWHVRIRRPCSQKSATCAYGSRGLG
jgi:hypothetical protein